MVTNTLQRIVNVAQIYIRQAPLTFPALPAPNDLVLLAGDWVRQFILSPPFAWRWNRSVYSFTTVPNQQDYSIAVPKLGWIEKATITDSAVSPAVTYELEVQLNLAQETAPNQPVYISAQLDDNEDNITFRLSPPPYKAYNTVITVQNAPDNFDTLTDTWDPIPDYLSYLYTQGFMARVYEYFVDERFGSAMSLFVKQLVAANGGLSETQANIFLSQSIDTMREQRSSQLSAQNAVQGRFLG